MKYTIKYSDKIYDSDYSCIVNLLNNYYINDLKESNENIRRGFGVYAKDAKDNLIGGLVGYSELKWLYLDSMYIFEKFRGIGLARKFLKIAENEAKSRNCIGVKFESFKKTVNLYKNLGYKTYYIEKDSSNHDIYYMKKKLKPNE